MVAVTAHAMGGDRERILVAGCDMFVSQPYLVPELLAVVPDQLIQPQPS